MKKIYISILFLLIYIISIAQSITPATLGIAGVTSQQNNYTLTFSAGESISITEFKNQNNYSLNSGFLQNFTPLITGIFNNLELLSKVGYLYRTTAVYGSGKFGLADRFRIKNREEINGPFRLEMMLVYLVRQFTFDQVNHVAHHKNPKKAVKLDEQICKNLGIGNSTGLGMAPFIVNHPTLLNNWILSRETALKKIREIRKHFTNSRMRTPCTSFTF